MNLKRIDIDQMLLHETGRILWEGDAGVIAQSTDGGLVLSDVADGALLREKIRELFPQGHRSFCVHSDDAAQALRAEFGLSGEMYCSQWVYTAQEAPEYPPHDIRPLAPQDVPLAAAHYHLVDDSEAYLAGRAAAGRAWGLYENGALAGFIGVHSEGSMGMLEIFPEYRRKGYGYALEAFAIGLHLRRGWTPYSQVVRGNEASVKLQEKVRMELCAEPAIWLF